MIKIKRLFQMSEKELEQIRSFVESDCVDLTNVLVINEDGDFLERYSFNGVRPCVEASDKEIIAISFQGHLISDDCCEGCMSCAIDDDGAYYCLEKSGEKLDCVLDMIKESHEAYQQYLLSRKMEAEGY